MKVILQGSGDLVAQACVAHQALADGRPECPKHRKAFRLYERDDGSLFSVAYNKDSITVWPQEDKS